MECDFSAPEKKIKLLPSPPPLPLFPNTSSARFLPSTPVLFHKTSRHYHLGSIGSSDGRVSIRPVCDTD